MKPVEIHEHLSEVPLFKELTADELVPFVDISKGRLYKKNTFVFMEDEPLDRVFFIKEGRIKIYKTDFTGKEQIISVLEKDEMFPHAGFFRKGTFPANAEVLEEATLIVTPIKEFEAILIKKPELCIKVFRVLGEKIIDLQARLEEQILHNTYEQIVMLFLRLCHSNGVQVNSKEEIYKLTSSFTNRDLANMIGTSRETISRTINQLKKKKCIFIDEGHNIIIYKKNLEMELF